LAVFTAAFNETTNGFLSLLVKPSVQMGKTSPVTESIALFREKKPLLLFSQSLFFIFFLEIGTEDAAALQFGAFRFR